MKVFTAETSLSSNRTTLYVVVAESYDKARGLIEEQLNKDVEEKIEFVDEIHLDKAEIVTSLTDDSGFWTS